MPCYDSRDDEPYRSAQVVEEARREFTHNSPVAELLCTVMKHLQNEHSRGYVSVLANHPEVSKWWADHQERDRRKAIANKARAEKKQHNDAIDREIAALQKKRK